MTEINSNSNLFKESIVYRPFYYPKAVEIDKEHEIMHWIEDEVQLGDDVNQWKSGKITPDEKAFVTNVFKFFTTTDVMVGTFYIDHLIPVIKNNEVRNMLVGFAGREKTHQKAYALLNDTLGLPESIYSSFLDYKEMKEKAEYTMEADSSTVRGLALALAKDMFSEGVSLFSSFAMLLNFKRYGKLMGMSKILDWSILDENVTLDTEVLTKNGWVTVDTVSEGDEILEWDMETQITSFKPINKIKDLTREYTFEYNSDSFHQHVSGGHRMIIEKDDIITESTGEKLDVNDDFNFITAGNKIGDSELTDEMKIKIKEAVEKDESLDWVYPLLDSMSSDTALEFLQFYSSLT